MIPHPRTLGEEENHCLENARGDATALLGLGAANGTPKNTGCGSITTVSKDGVHVAIADLFLGCRAYTGHSWETVEGGGGMSCNPNVCDLHRSEHFQGVTLSNTC